MKPPALMKAILGMLPAKSLFEGKRKIHKWISKAGISEHFYRAFRNSAPCRNRTLCYFEYNNNFNFDWCLNYRLPINMHAIIMWELRRLSAVVSKHLLNKHQTSKIHSCNLLHVRAAFYWQVKGRTRWNVQSRGWKMQRATGVHPHPRGLFFKQLLLVLVSTPGAFPHDKYPDDIPIRPSSIRGTYQPLAQKKLN